jgi:hypothetical protein
VRSCFGFTKLAEPPTHPRQPTNQPTNRPTDRPTASPPPATWWTHESDLALIVGAWRHGCGCYDGVRYDPELAHAFPVADGDGGGTQDGMEVDTADRDQRQPPREEQPAEQQPVEQQPAGEQPQQDGKEPPPQPSTDAAAGSDAAVTAAPAPPAPAPSPTAGWPSPAALDRRLRWLMDVLSDTADAAGGAEGLSVDPLPPARAPWAGKTGDAAADAAAAMAAQGAYKEDDFVWGWGNEMDMELEGLFAEEAEEDGAGEGGRGKGKGGEAKQAQVGGWLAWVFVGEGAGGLAAGEPTNQSHPTQLINPIHSNPIQSNPIRSNQVPERAWMKRERLDLLKFVMTWGAPAPPGRGDDEWHYQQQQPSKGGGGAAAGGGDRAEREEEDVASKPGCRPEDWRAARWKLQGGLATKPLLQLARVYQVGGGWRHI